MRKLAAVAGAWLVTGVAVAQQPEEASPAQASVEEGEPEGGAHEAGDEVGEPKPSTCEDRSLCVVVKPPERPRGVALVLSEAPGEGAEASSPVLELGGALRFNLFYKSWEQGDSVISGRDDVAFDTFRLNVDSYYRGLHMSAEYRFYAGYNMLQHGYLSFERPNAVAVSVGVVRAPFGLLPYASHNYFFGLGYYVGLEDDADLGVRADFRLGPVDVQVAYFRNDEGSYSGTSVDSARYSYDVVRVSPDESASLDTPRRNEEVNQGNVRLTYDQEHPGGATEVGVSGQLGGVYNADANASGIHWAAAGHLHGRYGPIDVQLQYVHYRYELENPPGQDRDFVMMGAYDAPYRVASDGGVLTANLAYVLEVDRWVLDSVTFYDDYSWLRKPARGFRDSHQNVAGVLLHLGPIYTYVDFVVGKHHPWISGDYGNALAEGASTRPWETRVNANLGYYF